MKNKLFLLFTLLAVAVGCTKPDDNQDNPTPPAPSEESLVISVDNESIYADGLEVATFTVEYTIDGETTDVTSEVTILEDKAGAIKGNTFSTTVAVNKSPVVKSLVVIGSAISSSIIVPRSSLWVPVPAWI